MKFSELKTNRFVRGVVLRLSILILFVSISSLALFFLINNISESSTQSEELRKRVDEMNLAGETFSSLIRDYQIISPYFYDIENILPTKDRLINFSEEISNIANSLNISHSFIFKNEGEIDDLNFIDFSIVLKQVNISNLSSFLDSLKNSQYFVDLISFDISGSRERDSDNISVSLFGRIFIKNI
jgi:hypothetical protein